jgi:hypothetical protein
MLNVKHWSPKKWLLQFEQWYTEHMPETPEHSVDRRQELEKIQTPEELLSFLEGNISYGFIGKNDKVYAHDDKDWDADFDKEYFLQSPEELLGSGHGVCWDTVELERRWFSEHGFYPETYFMMYAKEGGTKLPTHTFLIFEKNGTWFWFEHAFADHRGMHEYPSREELIEDVKNKHHEYATQHRGAADEDFAQLRVGGYEQLEYGSSPQRLGGSIIEKNRPLIVE